MKPRLGKPPALHPGPDELMQPPETPTAEANAPVPNSAQPTGAEPASGTIALSDRWHFSYTSLHWSDLLAPPTLLITFLAFLLGVAGLYYQYKSSRQDKKAPSGSRSQPAKAIATVETGLLGRGKSTEFTLLVGEEFSEPSDEGWSLRLLKVEKKLLCNRAKIQIASPIDLLLGENVRRSKRSEFWIDQSYISATNSSVATTVTFKGVYHFSTLSIKYIDLKARRADVRIVHFIENRWPEENNFPDLATVDYAINITSHKFGDTDKFPLTIAGTVGRELPSNHELWLFTVQGPGLIPQGWLRFWGNNGISGPKTSGWRLGQSLIFECFYLALMG